eukprot:CAMPEP_0115861960 /NCGR_PEP_ID=MMETSP0287-20121206/17930_1 /TAXON_ID=412157 /ORGANISM="Chrysochromulina rotalis, Strain UIO044" /LENGTH=64 /DNA_ID=CAMNT_0003316367 /DNA_START=361 /DNA_END=555 /DNA_ORIENTATION=-
MYNCREPDICEAAAFIEAHQMRFANQQHARRFRALGHAGEVVPQHPSGKSSSAHGLLHHDGMNA